MNTRTLLGVFCAAFLALTSASAAVLIDPAKLGGIGSITVDGKPLPGIELPATAKQIHLTLPPDLRDWSNAKTITLRLYSPAASGAKALLILRAANDEKTGPKDFPMNYWRTTLTFNWQGWKDVEIPFKSFVATRVEGTPAQIQQLILRNQFGPENKETNTWGIPFPNAVSFGFGRIIID
jgi:hypothetical protein